MFMRSPEFYRVCMHVCMHIRHMHVYMYVFMSIYACVGDYISTHCYSEKIFNWKLKDLVQSKFYQFQSYDMEDIM